MISLGSHADFIVTAYAVALAVVIGLIAWILLDYRTQQSMLDDLEKRGVKRRSRRPGRK
jgi:heme exporter protein D